MIHPLKSELPMKIILNFFKNLIHPVNTLPTENKVFRDFNYDEAVNGALFQLRNGKAFELVSFTEPHHGGKQDYTSIMIRIAGENFNRWYYRDGFANELEPCGFDLVMSH